MTKKAIIGTLLSFLLITGGISYTIYNSVINKEKTKVAINNEKAILETAKSPNELKDGEYEATAEGYEGPITVKVVIKDGKIFSVDVISQNETPEYYVLAKNILQSIIQQNTFNVDSISGATVTSDAIKIAVYKALLQAGAKSSDVAINLEKENKDLKEKAKSKVLAKKLSAVAGTVSLARDNLENGTFIGIGYGYNGPIRVSVTISNGVITSANVISHNDDYPYFNWALRVLSSIISGSDNVDTVSGATVSSRGILNAVNNALSQAGSIKNKFDVEDNDSIIQRNEPFIEHIKKNFKNLTDGIYIGNASGYYSNSIQVKVVVKEGQIFSIELLKNGDDKQYFNSDKANVLSTRIIEKQSTDIDTITNATVSSKGFINAVIDALIKAGDGSVKKLDNKNTPYIPPVINQMKKNFSNLIKGTYEGYAKGYRGDGSVGVRVTVDDNGKISNIELITNNDDIGYFNFNKADILKARIIEKQSTDVDTVTNATISSKAYINAVLNALQKALDPNSNEANKYIIAPKTIISTVGENITLERIRNSFEKLPENVKLEIKKDVDVNKLGKYELVVELIFSDKSKKIVNIPVSINEKEEGSFKFKSMDEIKKLDLNKYPEPNKIECEIEGFEFREKGKGEWIKTEGYQKGEFAQDLIVDYDLVKNIEGKEIEFRVVTKEKESGKQTIFTLNPSESQKEMYAKFDGSKSYSLDTLQSKVAEYKLPFVNYLISLKLKEVKSIENFNSTDETKKNEKDKEVLPNPQEEDNSDSEDEDW